MDAAGRRVTRIAKVWVDVVWWLGLAFSILLAVLLLCSPLLLRNGINEVGIAVSVSEDSSPTPALTTADALRVTDPRLEVEAADTRRLTFRTTHLGVFFVVVWSLLPALAAGLLGAHLLRSFLGDVLAGDVFTRTNAGRLSRLAWLVIGVGLAAPLFEYGTSWMVLEMTQLSGVAMAPAYSVDWQGPIIGGLLLHVLASSWRYGAELQRDRDLTV